MGELFYSVLYQPLYNLLVGLYDLMPWGGLGLAIILMTLVVKSAVFPLTFRSMKAQRELQELQPKIAEIKEKHKDDKEAMAKELMNVYKHHNVNPFASCLPTILQLFVFIALYRVLAAGIETIDPSHLYSFISNPGTMNHFFLGIDLAAVSIPLAAAMAVAQFFQARQMVVRRPPKVAQGSASLDEDVTATMNKMTMTVLPIMMFVIGATTLPAGLSLYILVSTIFTYVLYHFFLPATPSTK